MILIGLELRRIPNVQVEEQEKTDREDSDVKGGLETPEMAPSASQNCLMPTNLLLSGDQM